MTILFFILAAMLYATSASLPFLVTKNTQMILAVVIGIFANLCWVQIVRSIPEPSIPLYGLIYDGVLTLMFLLVPFIFIPFSLTTTQIIGIMMILSGFFLIK